jgi:hypothetical protein
MEREEKNKCVYCGDPNCDLKCKPISELNEYLIFAVGIISFSALLYFCFC